MASSEYEINRACCSGELPGIKSTLRRRGGTKEQTMSKLLNNLIAVLVFTFLVSSMALADPLVGRDILKFQQLPMVTTPIEGAIYWGHDEGSTLYDDGFGVITWTFTGEMGREIYRNVRPYLRPVSFGFRMAMWDGPGHRALNFTELAKVEMAQACLPFLAPGPAQEAGPAGSGGGSG